MTTSLTKLGIAALAVAGAVGLGALVGAPIHSAMSQAAAGNGAAAANPMAAMMAMHGVQMTAMLGAPAAVMPGHDMGVMAPVQAGQAAFGAIQEIVAKLEADPATDWTKVDLEALRQHLIDMDAVTLGAEAQATQVPGGLAVTVTGAGRTLAAIQRMLPAHADELSQLNGWTAKTESLPGGILLTVTASDAAEVQHIRGLGFIGLLASGAHHQPHHLAIATGAPVHQH